VLHRGDGFLGCPLFRFLNIQKNIEIECQPFVIEPTPVEVPLWVVIKLAF